MKGLKFMDRELVAEWFRFADDDIDTVLLLKDMRPQHYAIICSITLTSSSPPHHRDLLANPSKKTPSAIPVTSPAARNGGAM